MFVLDTNVLIWLVTGDQRLSRKARTRIERRGNQACAMSSLSLWELGYALERRRINMGLGLAELRAHLLSSGISELPLTGDIVMDALSLGNLSPDPIDRMIVATARKADAVLVTSDSRMLEWPGDLERLDAQS